MSGQLTEDSQVDDVANQVEDYRALLKYINWLAYHKLGYPVSLLTFLGVVNNKVLGIEPGSLANVLLNNVGDPFKDSETSLMEVKTYERRLIQILEKFYNMPKDSIRGYVTTGGTEGNFAGLWWSKRYLINSLLNELIVTDDKIKLLLKQQEDLNLALMKIPNNDFHLRSMHLQMMFDTAKSISGNQAILQQLLTPTAFYGKNSTHYSVPKIAEILRLNIRPVLTNTDGSINLENFKKELMLHSKAHPYSSIIVIANIGTTITGAIDDIPAIKKILDETLLLQRYTIHVDGALTGFIIPIIKPFGDIDNYFDVLGVNTLAFSAHKYLGLSQPCGIILANKRFFEKAFDKSERNIDYVGNILDVTITGSRSGLNVLMFYHALMTLEINKNNDKLTKMVETNLENAKYLYKKLVQLYGESNVTYYYHFNINFPKPSMHLAKKYQLMLTGEKATICVLTNVSKDLIDTFILDLKNDKEKSYESP